MPSVPRTSRTYIVDRIGRWPISSSAGRKAIPRLNGIQRARMTPGGGRRGRGGRREGDAPRQEAGKEGDAGGHLDDAGEKDELLVAKREAEQPAEVELGVLPQE